MAQLAASLEPISLAEVTEEADLQTRVDKKYLVPLTLVTELVREFAQHMLVLDIDGQRVFGYESVYFDTADLQLFRDHAQNRRIRHKVRTRHYTDSGLAMLEVKAKGRRGETVKHRRHWQVDDLMDIRTGGHHFVGSHLAGRPRVDELQPVLRSTYRRMTLVHASGGLRVTCDSELAFEGPNGWVTMPPGRVLVETKSSNGRSSADQYLRRCGEQDIAVSKYCAGVALTAGLPANRWHRALRSYLGLREEAHPD